MYDTNFEARGVGSSDTLVTSVGSADVNGQNSYVFKTVPTVSSVALGSTTLLNGGENDIYSFKISADSAEDVAIKQIELDINSSATGATATIGTFRLFRGSNDITDQVSIRKASASNVSLESGGISLFEGSTSAFILFSTEELISAGSSTTFTVKATVSDFTASNDFISVKIADDVLGHEGDTYICDSAGDATDNLAKLCSSVDETVGTVDSFIWSDNSASAHSSTLDSSTADWFNGTLVDNLPTTGLTLLVP